MSKINTIPIDELLDDLLGAKEDSLVCQNAINQGILEYKSRHEVISVTQRLKDNEEIIVLIRNEIKNRCGGPK